MERKLDHFLIFMHIPKTGGHTLRFIIDKQYGRETVLRTGSIQELKKQLKTNQLNCVQSHLPFGLHRHCPKPYKYVTMLRDPVERILSNYSFLRNNPKAPPIRLEAFIKNKRFSDRLLNMQTRLASGKSIPGEADLERAKENLTQFVDVVGITEMFDESVFLMKQSLGWGDITYTKKNVTKKKPQKTAIPPDMIDMIKHTNRLDIELYHWAKTILEEKIRVLDAQSKQALHDFKHRGDE